MRRALGPVGVAGALIGSTDSRATYADVRDANSGGGNSELSELETRNTEHGSQWLVDSTRWHSLQGKFAMIFI